MRKFRDSDYDDDYREFKKPKRIEKDKFGKHRKAIYDMLDDEDEDYGDNIRYEFDEEY
jgi:hypothetical protein